MTPYREQFKEIHSDNLIDKLDEMGMLYFLIVSLFSVETLVDIKSCEASLKGIEKLRAKLSKSKRKDDPEAFLHLPSITYPLTKRFLKTITATP